MQKSGQATAEIRFRHDTLFVAATCDSLQELVYRYEEQIEKLQTHSENYQEKKSQVPRIWIWGLLLILIVVVNSIHTTSFNKK